MSSLEPALETLGLSELFVGLILIPVIGNAAEHSSAVMFALRNKVDVTLEIAIGSSTQIALFVAPVLVFISLAVGHPMDFVFSTFEVAAVGLSALLMTLISLDGESNWLEGLSWSARTSSWPSRSSSWSICEATSPSRSSRPSQHGAWGARVARARTDRRGDPLVRRDDRDPRRTTRSASPRPSSTTSVRTPHHGIFRDVPTPRGVRRPVRPRLPAARRVGRGRPAARRPTTRCRTSREASRGSRSATRT